jgi:hypothetical protein
MQELGSLVGPAGGGAGEVGPRAIVAPGPVSVYNGSYTALPAYTLRPPHEGNKTIPVELRWLSQAQPPSYTISFNARSRQVTPLSQISGLHIDNTNCSSSVNILFPDTGFLVVIGPNLEGYYPVLTGGLECFFWIDINPLAQDVTRVQILNFVPPPIEFGSASGGNVAGTVREVDTVAPLTGGPITDMGSVALTTPLAVGYGGTSAANGNAALDNLSGSSGATAGNLVRGGTGLWSVSAALVTPVSVANGGTGAAIGNTALDNLSGTSGTTVGALERTAGGVWSVTPLPIASLPVTVAQGGTGATTAPAALTSLGALALNGGTMTGALTLNADPTSALQAATKEYVDGLTGAPNKLINPFMEIDQANEGGVTGLSQYIIDGWPLTSVNAGALAVSNQRVTDAPPGYSNSIRTTVTTVGTPVAGTVLAFQYKLEGDDIIDTLYSTVGARTMSLAFWVKSSITGNYSVGLSNGAGTRSYAVPYTITTANTWQFVTATIPGDVGAGWTLSGNSAQMFVTFGIQLGSTYSGAANVWQAGNLPGVTGGVSNFITTSGATFQLGPCGLWVAPAPQPLLRTSIASELVRCQRYYEKSYPPGTSIGSTGFDGMSNIGIPAGLPSGTYNTQGSVGYRVTKRASPTITFFAPQSGTSGRVRDFINAADLTPNLVTGGSNGFSWGATAAVAQAGFNFGAHWTADARL